MNDNLERNLGEQPLAKIMAEYTVKDGSQPGLKAHDLVLASEEQLTHKMVSRAIKGRRLTPRVQQKILNALNKLSGNNFSLKDLFNY